MGEDGAEGSGGDPANERLEAENSRLRQELDALRALTATMLASRSWRLTAPLRAVLAWAARMRPARPVGAVAFSEREYRRWFAAERRRVQAARPAILAQLKAMERPARVSLVMVVREETPAAVAATIRSLQEQLHRDWELSIADDACAVPGVARALATAARDDARVKLLRLPEAAGPVAAANAALGLATGSHVIFLTPGDRLADTAMYEVAVALARSPGAVLVYADEDAVDANGAHGEPRFKPGWSPDLLLAQDYIGRAAFYQREAVRRLGGLRAAFAGAECYDLALRITGGAAAADVVAVPAVLYHRAGAPTPAPTPDPFPAARGRGEDEWPLVSVIVPTRDRAELLEGCVLGLLERIDYPRLEVLVVDNGSREPRTHALFDRLARDARVSVLPYPGPFNWSAMNNRAAASAKGEVLLLLNNDVAVREPGWLRALVRQALLPGVGAVGAKLLFADGSVQHAGLWLGPAGKARHLLRLSPGDDPGYLGQLAVARNLSAVTGACLAVRSKVFWEAGGLDEALPVAYNDVDFCLRVQSLGYRVVWTPHAQLLHLESATRGTDETAARRAAAEAARDRLVARWGERMERDPYFNPNLELIGEEVLALAWPSRRVPPWEAP